MPFVMVWGIPDDTPVDVLVRLRVDLVDTVSKEMEKPRDWVRVFFPKDLLTEPNLNGSEGGNTIYIDLDTGLFNDKPDTDQAPRKVTDAIAHVVWGAFGGLRETECMVGNCNPAWTSLYKAIM